MGDVHFLLQHDLSLTRLALKILISKIYQDTVITCCLKEKVTTFSSIRSCFPISTFENEIIELALERVKLLKLPKILNSEALYMVLMLGKKIVKWAEYVICNLKLDESYLDEIYWTYFGTIDEAKIYNSCWRKHDNFNKISENDQNLMMKINDGNYVFPLSLACIYGNKTAILYHQYVIIEEVQKFLRKINLPGVENKIDQIAATYLCFLYGKSYDSLYGKFVFSRFKLSGKVNISEVIFIKKDANTVKFLWKFLKNSEKEKVKLDLARDCLDYALDCSNINSCELWDENDNAAELVLFLINEMTFKQKNEFLTKYLSSVLHLFLQVWPYQEICLKLLEEESVQEKISRNGENLLNTLLRCMIKNFAGIAVLPEACLQKTVFHKLLEKVFSLVPKRTKDKVLFNENYYRLTNWIFPNAIKKFYEVFDLNSLSIIINDNDLKKEMRDLIYMGSWKFSELLETKELKLIVRFIEKVLINKDEKKKFIRNWNLENNLVVAENSDIKEKISAWLKA